MYLVTECITRSKPRSSGRWHQGLAKVLSAAVMHAPHPAEFGQRIEVGQAEHGVGGRLHPDHLGVRPDRRIRTASMSDRLTKLT